MKKRLKSTPPVKLIVTSFLLLILAGTLLLTLPITSRSGEPTALIDALFTSTSAVCVTGLVVFDTWMHWNTLGQVIIITLIQVGGLGVITLATGFSLLMRRKLGLRDIQLAVENTSGDTVHITRLVKMILAFTAACETAGALLLMIRFVPQFGPYGVWVSFFTAVSAFCNAGFDILGFVMENGSLLPYAGDPLVCLTVGALIVVGGLGFVVISDIYNSKISPAIHRQKPGHLKFHSTIVLAMTAVLIAAGTVLFYICERDNTLSGMNTGTRLNASLFQSISPRTAGFSSVDIAKEHDVTKIVTVILMFIGASPAGTGGGIKTTTFVVLAATVFSVLRGEEETTVLKRRIEKSTVYRSMSIFFVAMCVVLLTAGVIMTADPDVGGVDALFEAASAFGTVGLTAGVTPSLSTVSKFFVSCAMFIGRVGPVSLGLALILHKGRREAILPEGRIIVG